MPFNVLSAPWEPYTIAQNVPEAFRRTWPESLREAPHFVNIILAATLVLVEHKLTLVEMPRLLTDPYYRDTLLLVMAHQHRGQLGDNLQGVLENAQVRVIFPGSMRE